MAKQLHKRQRKELSCDKIKRILSLHSSAGNQEVKTTATLMNKLIESMLSICSGLTPDHRSRTVVYKFTVTPNTFAIRFHISLISRNKKRIMKEQLD